MIDPSRSICPKGFWICSSVLVQGSGWKMNFHIVTIFPDFFTGPFQYGVVGKGQAASLLSIKIHDLRHWTKDRHRTVDDRPFGGGEGMLLKPQPLFEGVEEILPARGAKQRVVL